MMPVSARGCSRLCLFLVVGLIACAARAVGNPPSDPANAQDFLLGQEKGFVIGSLDATKDAAYFKALAETGANLARLFVQIPQDKSGRQFVFAKSDARLLRRVLKFAGARGVRVVIVGGFEGVERPEFWSNEALRSSFVATWASLASAVGNDQAVAGLDLLNEPNPPAPSGSMAERQRSWRSLAERTIAVIRASHVALPVIFESIAGAASSGYKDLVPLQDSNVVYSFHFYTPHEITHQLVNATYSRKIPYPAGLEWQLGTWDPELGVSAIDAQRLALEMRDVMAFQERYHVPIYVGEFSCVRWAPDDSAVRYVKDALEIFTQHGWSWSYHEFRGWPGWDAEIALADPDARARSHDAPMMQLLRAYLKRSSP